MIQTALPGLESLLYGKRCRVCGERRPLKEYHRDAATKDGRTSYCKVCGAAHGRAYRKIRTEERAAYGRAYRAANRDKVLARMRAYYAAHREAIAVKHFAYCQTSKGRAAKKAAKARRRALPGGLDLSTAMIQEVMEASGGTCPYCSELFEDGHIDHIMPVSKGGTNDRENLVYCCAACNLSKGNKDLEYWLSKPSALCVQ